MGIPTLPKEIYRPSLDETIIDLIESIAKEELALSHLINSEANKIQAFIGKGLNFPTCPSTAEILTFNYSVNKLMDTVLMKEWLLLKKLETVSHIKTSLMVDAPNTPESDCCHCDDEHSYDKYDLDCETEECCDGNNNYCDDDQDCSCRDDEGECHEPK